VKSGTEDYLQLKYQIQDYQNKDRLSCRIRFLQRKLKLGRTKPTTGPHADHEPRLDIVDIESFAAAFGNF